LEWDDHIPSFDEVHNEAKKAERYLHPNGEDLPLGTPRTLHPTDQDLHLEAAR
jgi:hypothetical protein